MLDSCKTREERWEGVQTLITKWLEERQQVVVMYCSLSGFNPFSSQSPASINKLRQFCQILVDYISAGHFEVYDQLVKEAEDFKDDYRQLLQRLYPQITETTEIALDFNDTYDTDEHCTQAMDSLKHKLSELGEHLVNRFAMEDRLIHALHTVHGAQMEPA